MSNIRFDQSADHTCVTLDGRVDIRNASELQKVLCDAVAIAHPIVIDCISAEWLDTACLQLILAAHRAAPGRVTVKVGSEGSVRQWLDQSGFAAELTLA
ncbi:MAG: STAS domain-containing protein [Pirellulaceae bacterium]|nr:STAS domain-containing protein [Pirellulaceae bacterium]